MKTILCLLTMSAPACGSYNLIHASELSSHKTKETISEFKNEIKKYINKDQIHNSIYTKTISNIITNSLQGGRREHDWGTRVPHSWKHPLTPAWNNDFDHLYYNDLKNIHNLHPVSNSINDFLDQRYAVIKLLIDAGILIGSFIGLPETDGASAALMATDFMDFEKQINALNQFISEGHNYIKVGDRIMSCGDLLEDILNIQSYFNSDNSINFSTRNQNYPLESGVRAIEDTLSYSNDEGTTFFNNVFTSHISVNNVVTGMPEWSNDYAAAGYSIQNKDIYNANLPDTKFNKEFLFDYAKPENADGYLFFGPSLFSTYKDADYGKTKQARFHAYLKPTISWNTGSNFYNNIVLNYEKQDQNINATIMPSVISNCLSQANTGLDGQSYYSYGDDNKIDTEYSMGALGIELSSNTTNYWPDDGNPPSWISNNATFTKIKKGFNGNQDSETKLNGAIPILNNIDHTDSDNKFYVWSENGIGDHQSDIMVPFKVANMDKGIYKILHG